MSTKEKKLLGIALLVFAGIILPLKLIPLALDQYQQRRERVQQLKDNIERYQRLEEQGALWQERHAAILEQQKEIQDGLLQGSTRDLVAARLQAILKETAQQAKVQVQSLDLPEFTTPLSGEWLLITQNMHFIADSAAFWDFLKKLTENPTWVAVLSLDLRAYQNNQVNGSIKVTGFSAALGESHAPAAPPAER